MEYLAKVVACGNTGVGKTCLFVRTIQGKYQSQSQSTIGVEFAIKEMTPTNDPSTRIKLQLWDTAGQERYRAITKAYFRGASCVLCVFDVTNRESLDAMDNSWIPEAKAESPKDAFFYLVGNKADKEEDRLVQAQEALEVAHKYGMMYIETSAKTGTGVENIFQTLADKIAEKKTMEDNKKEDVKREGETIQLKKDDDNNEAEQKEEEVPKSVKKQGCSC